MPVKTKPRTVKPPTISIVDCTMHCFEKERHHSKGLSRARRVNFFSVWVCSAGLIRSAGFCEKAPQRFEHYLNRPLAVLMADFNDWHHSTID